MCCCRQVPFRTHSPLQAAYAVAMERERPPVALKNHLAPFAAVRYIPPHPHAAALSSPHTTPSLCRPQFATYYPVLVPASVRYKPPSPHTRRYASSQVILACWDESPARRPDAAEVVEMLTTLEAAMPTPLEARSSGSFLQSLIKKSDSGMG